MAQDEKDKPVKLRMKEKERRMKMVEGRISMKKKGNKIM